MNIETEANALVNAVLKRPENWMFVDAILAVGDHDGAGGSFMYGFTTYEPMSYDNFVTFQQTIMQPLLGELDPDYDNIGLVNASAAYDDYLSSKEEFDAGTILDIDMTEKWNKLCNSVLSDNHSGASYGVTCRLAQQRIREIVTGN